ncbi:MAG: efflux RND transporter permease subunit, partial [Verrucomicrobiales bacterium]|nr:efflux RND transporter permease subunit [Verrucomicrobiales bacterium]
MIEWFAKNHVAANFLMLLVLVLGLKTWLGLKKEIFPETAVDIVVVTVPYPSAAPEEVERGVVMPIEEDLQDLNGIKKITSSSAEGVGLVIVEVKSGFDVRDLMTDVKTRVDAIENFPEEAEEPLIQEIFIKNQTLSIGVSADTDERTLRELAEGVRRDLLLLPEISQVEVVGGRNYEISIEVSERALREFGVTFDSVAQAVRQSSLDLPGGSVKTEGGEVLVRTNAKRYRAVDFESITLLTRENGAVVTLGQVAEVIDGFVDSDRALAFDNTPALLVKVFRTGDEDTLEVAAAAKR